MYKWVKGSLELVLLVWIFSRIQALKDAHKFRDCSYLQRCLEAEMLLAFCGCVPNSGSALFALYFQMAVLSQCCAKQLTQFPESQRTLKMATVFC